MFIRARVEGKGLLEKVYLKFIVNLKRSFQKLNGLKSLGVGDSTSHYKNIIMLVLQG